VHDQAAAHLAYLLSLHKFVSLLAVPLVHASGEEILDGAPRQFPAPVSKQLRRTGIGKADDAGVVDEHLRETETLPCLIAFHREHIFHRQTNVALARPQSCEPDR
jgi:hypothetical protein